MSLQPKKLQVWNQWDEFGLLAGLAHWTPDNKTLKYVRYPGENNKQLKSRTLLANKHKGNSTLQGMLNNIIRDLSITPSGYNPTIYNTETKRFFYLSENPYTLADGIKVYVSSSGSWSESDRVYPQVRASGYPTATNGWIVWNSPDYDPSLIPPGMIHSKQWYDQLNNTTQFTSNIQLGEYSRILEFINTSIPDTGDRIKIEYQVQTGTNINGQVVLNWRSDFSNIDDPLDLNFVGKKSEYPTDVNTYNTFKSSNISLFTLDQLNNPVISGVFYTTEGKPTIKLIEIKDIVNNEYPLYWNKFKYDIGRWDQLEDASVGSVASFHDESISDLAQYPIRGGCRYGVDLNCVKVQRVGNNARAKWYPVFAPGEFYINNEKFYMFGSMQYQNIKLTELSNNIYSGNLTGEHNEWPLRLGVISVYTSGNFYDDPQLQHNPYIKRLHDFSKPITGIYYRTPYVDYKSTFDINNFEFNSNNFYYNYDSGAIFISGVANVNVVVAWEHPGVYASGALITYSGGFGLNEFDFNPLTDSKNKILYIN